MQGDALRELRDTLVVIHHSSNIFQAILIEQSKYQRDTNQQTLLWINCNALVQNIDYGALSWDEYVINKQQ